MSKVPEFNDLINYYENNTIVIDGRQCYGKTILVKYLISQFIKSGEYMIDDVILVDNLGISNDEYNCDSIKIAEGRRDFKILVLYEIPLRGKKLIEFLSNIRYEQLIIVKHGMYSFPYYFCNYIIKENDNGYYSGFGLNDIEWEFNRNRVFNIVNDNLTLFE